MDIKRLSILQHGNLRFRCCYGKSTRKDIHHKAALEPRQHYTRQVRRTVHSIYRTSRLRQWSGAGQI